MKEHDIELIRDYLDGSISAENLAELNRLLENSSEARARFRSLAALEEGLRDLAELPAISRFDRVGSSIQSYSIGGATPAPRKPSPIASGFLRRPLFAAAAGLVLGIVCTSAIWAASESGRQKILTLIHESFEIGPSPKVSGVPTELEVWSGDFTETVSAGGGVRPIHGEKMLRFVRADHEGKQNPVGYISDLYRVLDLRSFESTLMNDDAVASVEAGFRSVSFQDPDRYQCGISIYALEGVPTSRSAWRDLFETRDRLMEDSLATAQRWIFLDSEGEAWEKGRTELRVPAEAKFLVLGIRISDRSAIRSDGEEPPAVEFSGQFVDDIRVTLRRSASHP